ncbi:MAG: hypothetical protein WCF00_05045 [Azonexus sp.]
MSRSILARADALMHRRRQSGTEPDDVPVLVDAIDPDMDIPVLIDAEPQVTVVESLPEPEPAAVPEARAALDDEMLDIVVREITRRVHERIAAELPAIVADTVRNLLAEPEILEQLRSRD